MITGLMVLNSAVVGSRDLFWVDDPDKNVVGYSIYRAFDAPINWTRINPANDPHPGHYYRDLSTLEAVDYTVDPTDWVERGETGKWGLKLPDIPYATVVSGIPNTSSSPDDVQLFIDDTQLRPSMVSAIDKTVWFQMDDATRGQGAVSAFPLFPGVTEDSVVRVVYYRLSNFVDIYTSMTRTYYTVVPVYQDGREQHVPGKLGTPVVDTMQLDTMDYMQREMVRRNAWLFEQVAEPAYLMFRRTKGTPCNCATALGQARTACPSCFETSIVGGYYGPIDLPFIDPDAGAVRTLEEGGVKVERQSRSYLGPTPIVQDGDLIIRRNGERLVINNVVYKSPRGVLLQQEFDCQLLQRGDTRYLIPLKLDPVVIFDPTTRERGNEPVVDTRKASPVVWENPKPEIGRTVTFKRIQS